MCTLGSNIKTKHVADGVSSPLPDKLTVPFLPLVDEAIAANEEQKTIYRDAERETETLYLLLGIGKNQDSRTVGTVLFNILVVRDVLLGLYRGEERKLGDWGFTVDSPKDIANVIIPGNSTQIVKLAKSIVAKHVADGVASPLPAANLTQLQTLLTDADTSLSVSKKLYRSAEKATQKRNKLLGIARGQNTQTENTLLFFLISFRDFLLGLHRGAEQTLGDWGYTVNMSIYTPPPPPPTP